MNGRLPVTAIIASRNEAALLQDRLAELARCDEVIVIDLESTDRTSEIAEAAGARLVHHALVPIAGGARAEVAGLARHDWLLFADPDERLPAAALDAAGTFLA